MRFQVERQVRAVSRSRLVAGRRRPRLFFGKASKSPVEGGRTQGEQGYIPPPVGSHFPPGGLVGCDDAALAVSVLAVDPTLGGLLLTGPPGTGKSILVSNLIALMSGLGRDSNMPVVYVPSRVDDDGLLGAINIERTLATGSPHNTDGLLALADGGVLVVERANALEASASAHIAAALETGSVTLERHGVSRSLETRFVFAGTVDPADGYVHRVLFERVALIVDTTVQSDADERAEVVSRWNEFLLDAGGFVARYADDSERLTTRIVAARDRLAEVRWSSKDVRLVSAASLRLGVEGNRADLSALKTARAHAALNGRASLTEDDIQAAIRFVLRPRARRMEQTTKPGESEAENDESNTCSDDSIAGEPDSPDANGTGGRASEPPPSKGVHKQAEELIMPSEELTIEPPGTARFQRAEAPGRGAASRTSRRGRVIDTTTGPTSDRSVSVTATIRAAALRLAKDVSASGHDDHDNRIRVKKEDLRYKLFKRRSGTFYIVAVDASWSMVLNRMSLAKGMLIGLLGDAYRRRDKVALIAFRGTGAELLLPPTRSLSLARELVETLPAGGATPLAAGLVAALDLWKVERLRGMTDAILLVLTDGRVNVALEGAPGDESKIESELRALAAVIEESRIEPVLIDTRSRFVSGGDARRLAELIGARYIYLQPPGQESMAEMTRKLSRNDR